MAIFTYLSIPARQEYLSNYLMWPKPLYNYSTLLCNNPYQNIHHDNSMATVKAKNLTPQ
jgi:hypothetical protein